MKILHCADIHLDSKMESNLPQKKANQRRKEIRDTFLKMIAYAREEKIEVVLIAGDLFDEGRCSVTTAEMVVSAIRENPQIDFLYLRGNHDEKDILLSQELPKNLKTFGSKWTTYKYGDIAISGAEINRENFKTIYSELKLDPSKTNIVMLHGQTSTKADINAVDINSLRDKDIDYLALGHLHSFGEGTIDGRGRWVYSGCLEGRGFDECGKKGFVVIDAQAQAKTQRAVSYRFVQFASRELYEVKVDITGLESVSEIIEAARNSIGDIDVKCMIKLVIVGTYSEKTNKDIDTLKDNFSEFFFCKVKDESRLLLNPRDYENDISLQGEFVRSVIKREDIEQEQKEKILLCGLRALYGDEVVL